MCDEENNTENVSAIHSINEDIQDYFIIDGDRVRLFIPPESSCSTKNKIWKSDVIATLLILALVIITIIVLLTV